MSNDEKTAFCYSTYIQLVLLARFNTAFNQESCNKTIFCYYNNKENSNVIWPDFHHSLGSGFPPQKENRFPGMSRGSFPKHWLLIESQIQFCSLNKMGRGHVGWFISKTMANILV